MTPRTGWRTAIAVLTCLALAPIAPVSAWAGQRLRVTDKQGGCSYDADAGYSLRQSAQGFGRGGKRVPTDEFRRLREVLLDASDGRDSLLQALGITQATIDAQRHAILEAALHGDSVTPPVLPSEVRSLLDLDSVKRMVFEELDAVESDSVIVSTSWCSFAVELPGDPPIVASSRSCQPWMLPWTIRAGEREWRSWSTEVPKALSRLTVKDSPNAGLLDGTHYWSEDFWSDTSFWRGTLREGLGVQLNAHHARQLATGLDGWTRASVEFELVEAETGLINSCELSLALSVKPRGAVSIDGVRWYNRLADGLPTFGWDTLLALAAEAEAAVAKQPWLADWRAQGGEIWLVAHDELGCGCGSLETWVLPAWRDAGNSGAPKYELNLTGSGKGYARVYLGQDEPASVITWAGLEGDGAHWLYGKDVSFHPSKPEYLLVTPDGGFERRKAVGR